MALTKKQISQLENAKWEMTEAQKTAKNIDPLSLIDVEEKQGLINGQLEIAIGWIDFVLGIRK